MKPARRRSWVEKLKLGYRVSERRACDVLRAPRSSHCYQSVRDERADPETVIVDEIQLPLIRALEKRHFTVVPLRYRHGRTLGGSWHCITLDTNRDGELVSYF